MGVLHPLSIAANKVGAATTELDCLKAKLEACQIVVSGIGGVTRKIYNAWWEAVKINSTDVQPLFQDNCPACVKKIVKRARSMADHYKMQIEIEKNRVRLREKEAASKSLIDQGPAIQGVNPATPQVPTTPDPKNAVAARQVSKPRKQPKTVREKSVHHDAPPKANGMDNPVLVHEFNGLKAGDAIKRPNPLATFTIIGIDTDKKVHVATPANDRLTFDLEEVLSWNKV